MHWYKICKKENRFRNWYIILFSNIWNSYFSFILQIKTLVLTKWTIQRTLVLCKQIYLWIGLPFFPFCLLPERPFNLIKLFWKACLDAKGRKNIVSLLINATLLAGLQSKWRFSKLILISMLNRIHHILQIN